MTEPSQRALDLAARMQRMLDAIEASTIDVQAEPANLRGLAAADHG